MNTLSLNRMFAASIMAAMLTSALSGPSAAQPQNAPCPPGYTQVGVPFRGAPGQPAQVLCKKTPFWTPTPKPTRAPVSTPTPKYPPTSTPRPVPSVHPTIPACSGGIIMPIYDAKRRTVVRYICPPRRLLPK
jgi:hypothetical protein